MSHLLHLDSSLRTDGSRSRKLSAHYANRWRAKNPDGTITYRDLTVDPVPHLDNVAVSAELVAAQGWRTVALDLRGHGDSDW